MRILLITDNHSLTGGAERSFFDLKSRLQNLPNVEVFSLGYGAATEASANHVVLPQPRNQLSKLFWRFCFHPLMYRRLKKHIQRFSPDIIHLHTIKNYTPTLLRAVKPYRVVHTVHDFSLICPTGQNIHQDLQPCQTGWHWRCFFKHHIKHTLPIYLLLSLLLLRTKRSLLKTIQAYTAPSPLLASYLQKNGFSHTYYVPPFITPPEPLAYELVKPAHFLFAGALGQHKGIHILLNEIALLKKTHPQCKIFIAGKGAEEKRLKQQAATLDITDNVLFIGWQTSLTPFIAQSQAVIFPSIGLEAFGLVITEALGNGRPIIGANRGTIAWLVKDQVTGLLFDPCKPGDLAQKMSTMIEQPTLTQTLGRQAFQTALQPFDNQKTLQQLLSIYANKATNTCATSPLN